jgi:Uncharacterized protein involved in exopolysaccharide biosynthesis
MKNKQHYPEEFSLFSLLNWWWGKRIWIIAATLVGIVLSVSTAFCLPKQYTSTVKMVARSDRSDVSASFSGLTSLMGLNLNRLQQENELDTALYPEIIGSIPFLAEMSQIEIDGKALSTYFRKIKQQSVQLTENSPTSREEQKLLDLMRKNFRIDTDKKSGLITVSATLSNPRTAAVAADSLATKLERYIIGYRIRKASDDFQFLSARFEEAQEKYYTVQQAYAHHADTHRHTAQESAAIERNRLYQEQQLAYTVYSQLAGQLETARLKVQEQTPVLAIIEPAHIPVLHSAPRRTYIVLVGTLAGLCLSLLFTAVSFIFFRKPE